MSSIEGNGHHLPDYPSVPQQVHDAPGALCVLVLDCWWAFLWNNSGEPFFYCTRNNRVEWPLALAEHSEGLNTAVSSRWASETCPLCSVGDNGLHWVFCTAQSITGCQNSRVEISTHIFKMLRKCKQGTDGRLLFTFSGLHRKGFSQIQRLSKPWNYQKDTWERGSLFSEGFRSQ